jgi:hypothetical protein
MNKWRNAKKATVIVMRADFSSVAIAADDQLFSTNIKRILLLPFRHSLSSSSIQQHEVSLLIATKIMTKCKNWLHRRDGSVPCIEWSMCFLMTIFTIYRGPIREPPWRAVLWRYGDFPLVKFTSCQRLPMYCDRALTEQCRPVSKSVV